MNKGRIVSVAIGSFFLYSLFACAKPQVSVDLTIDPAINPIGGVSINMAGTWRMEGITLVQSNEDPQLISNYLADTTQHQTGRLIPPYQGYLLELGDTGFLRANAVDLARDQLTEVLNYLNTKDNQTAIFNLITTTPPGLSTDGNLQVRFGLAAVSVDLMIGMIEFELQAPGIGRKIPYQGTFRFNLKRKE